jgi:hypothetical protein
MQLPFHFAKMKAPLPIGEKQLYIKTAGNNNFINTV